MYALEYKPHWIFRGKVQVLKKYEVIVERIREQRA